MGGVNVPNLNRRGAVVRLFRRYGYEIVDIRHRGHWQVKARRGNEPVRHFTVSTSPGSTFSRKQLVASLKRGHSRWSGSPPK